MPVLFLLPQPAVLPSSTCTVVWVYLNNSALESQDKLYLFWHDEFLRGLLPKIESVGIYNYDIQHNGLVLCFFNLRDNPIPIPTNLVVGSFKSMMITVTYRLLHWMPLLLAKPCPHKIIYLPIFTIVA